jgi:hypothetical protein
MKIKKGETNMKLENMLKKGLIALGTAVMLSSCAPLEEYKPIMTYDSLGREISQLDTRLDLNENFFTDGTIELLTTYDDNGNVVKKTQHVRPGEGVEFIRNTDKVETFEYDANNNLVSYSSEVLDNKQGKIIQKTNESRLYNENNEVYKIVYEEISTTGSKIIETNYDLEEKIVTIKHDDDGDGVFDEIERKLM